MEFSTKTTKLSQTCQCGSVRKKNLSDRIHQCNCGIICQRDLYSAFLAKFVDENERLQANQAKLAWSGTEPFLLAAWRQATKTETNLRVEGRVPSSFGSFPESERVAIKVLIADAKDLDVVPFWESQVEASQLLEPPSL